MPRKAFIAMPFRTRYDGILDVIRRALKDIGIDPVRIDDLSFTGSIVERMRSEISQSDLMIAIVAEENGNVYYEIGLAHCQNIPVILLTDDVSKLKFDLKDHRAVVYEDNNPQKVFDELLQMIRVTIDTKIEYPHDYFANVYGQNPKTATELGRKKVAESLKARHRLEEPVDILEWDVLENGELAVIVGDFRGKRVRAKFDRNGYLSWSKEE